MQGEENFPMLFSKQHGFVSGTQQHPIYKAESIDISTALEFISQQENLQVSGRK